MVELILSFGIPYLSREPCLAFFSSINNAYVVASLALLKRLFNREWDLNFDGFCRII